MSARSTWANLPLFQQANLSSAGFCQCVCIENLQYQDQKYGGSQKIECEPSWGYQNRKEGHTSDGKPFDLKTSPRQNISYQTGIEQSLIFSPTNSYLKLINQNKKECLGRRPINQFLQFAHFRQINPLSYKVNQYLQGVTLQGQTGPIAMGNNKSKNNVIYDPTDNAQLIKETPLCRYYRDRYGDEFQKYTVRHSGKSDFENNYQYRIRNHFPFLVDLYSARVAQSTFRCSSDQQYQVVTQRIPMRLSDLSQIDYQTGMNMIFKSLKGFEKIYKSQGALLVKDSMIGLNKGNMVKVWMNSNFAINDKEQTPISYVILSEQEKQITIVHNIIQIIASKSSASHQWSSFVNEKIFRQRKEKFGFESAIQFCRHHAEKNGLTLNELTPCYINNKNNSHGNKNNNSSSNQINKNNSQGYKSKDRSSVTDKNLNLSTVANISDKKVQSEKNKKQGACKGPPAPLSILKSKIIHGHSQIPRFEPQRPLHCFLANSRNQINEKLRSLSGTKIRIKFGDQIIQPVKQSHPQKLLVGIVNIPIRKEPILKNESPHYDLPRINYLNKQEKVQTKNECKKVEVKVQPKGQADEVANIYVDQQSNKLKLQGKQSQSALEKDAVWRNTLTALGENRSEEQKQAIGQKVPMNSPKKVEQNAYALLKYYSFGQSLNQIQSNQEIKLNQDSQNQPSNRQEMQENLNQDKILQQRKGPQQADNRLHEDILLEDEQNHLKKIVQKPNSVEANTTPVPLSLEQLPQHKLMIQIPILQEPFLNEQQGNLVSNQEGNPSFEQKVRKEKRSSNIFPHIEENISKYFSSHNNITSQNSLPDPPNCKSNENVLNLKEAHQNNEWKQKQSNGSQKQSIFKKAVQENATQIRMQTSKISIKSNSDRAGMISYKDLRDLLKSVRKTNN